MNLLKDWYDTLLFNPFLSVKIKIFIYNCDNDNSTENDCFIYLFLHVMINILLTPVYLTYLPCSLLSIVSPLVVHHPHCHPLLLYSSLPFFHISNLSSLYLLYDSLSIFFYLSTSLSPLLSLPFPFYLIRLIFSNFLFLSSLPLSFPQLFSSEILISIPILSHFSLLCSPLLSSSFLLSGCWGVAEKGRSLRLPAQRWNNETIWQSSISYSTWGTIYYVILMLSAFLIFVFVLVYEDILRMIIIFPLGIWFLSELSSLCFVHSSSIPLLFSFLFFGDILSFWW